MTPFCGFITLFSCIVIKVTLDPDDGCSLIAGAGRKVAKRTDKVGELTGCCTLGCHLTNKVIVLLCNSLLNSLFKCVTGKIRKIVVRKVFELKLVGCSLKA